jgi:hypothetical protein
MQLEGRVEHNCLETSDHPFRGAWRVEDDIILPKTGGADSRKALHDWLRRHCPFGERAATRAELTDAHRQAHFIRVLDEIDPDGFTALRAAVAMRGNRETLPPDALSVLDDLAAFRERADFGMAAFLVNSETNENVQQHNPDADGVFFTSASGTRLGVDEQGFFIADSFQVHFRAVRVFQQVIERDENDVPTVVSYTNVATGATVRSDAAVSGEMILWADGALQNARGKYRFDYPQELHVERRKLGAETYAYIVVPLARLCEVSIEASQPIHWRLKSGNP